MRKALLAILIGVFCLGVIVSGNVIIFQHRNKARAVEAFAELRQELPAAHTAGSGGAEALTTTPASVYGGLIAENPDLVGWLKISGTSIDYPVMQTPEDPEFYLNHGFDKARSVYGVPFADNASDLQAGDNIIIHGHNMADGQMFAPLLDYWDQDFYQQHQLINFDTPAAYGLYQIAAVLQVTVTKANPKAVDFARFASFDDEAEFTALQKILERDALYDTGESLVISDHLLILSTCEYSETNGRMVLVAKRLPD